MAESSTKPYLIRALHEWCTDNSYTPYIVVQVDAQTKVPSAHVHHGQITLNISHFATNQLSLGNERIEFQARFNQAIEDISVPLGAVSAIYAQETGAGMGFEVEESPPPALPVSPSTSDAETDQAADTAAEAPDSPDATSPGRPHLTIVK